MLSLSVTGQVDVYVGGKHLFTHHNDMVYSGIDLLSYCLAGYPRKIDGMYFEYENGSTPDLITPPTLNVEDGVEYYLSMGGNRDYVRVSCGIKSAPRASSNLYSVNRTTYHGSSDRSEGERGLGYSSADGSVVYGAALVSMGATREEDMVFARMYFPSGNFIARSDRAQIGFDWTVSLYHPEDV